MTSLAAVAAKVVVQHYVVTDVGGNVCNIILFAVRVCFSLLLKRSTKTALPMTFRCSQITDTLSSLIPFMQVFRMCLLSTKWLIKLRLMGLKTSIRNNEGRIFPEFKPLFGGAATLSSPLMFALFSLRFIQNANRRKLSPDIKSKSPERFHGAGFRLHIHIVLVFATEKLDSNSLDPNAAESCRSLE